MATTTPFVGTMTCYRGPVVLAPSTLRRRWLRKYPLADAEQLVAFESKIEEPHVGPMILGHEHLLVLYMTRATRWVPAGPGGYLVRLLTMHYQLDKHDAKEVAAALEVDLAAVEKWKRIKGIFQVEGDKLALFESPLKNDEDEVEDDWFRTWIDISLAKGAYEMDLAEVKLSAFHVLEVLRLRPQGQQLPVPAAAKIKASKAPPALRVTAAIEKLAVKLRYKSSEGGPVIAVAEEALAKWRGIDGDYDRLVDVTGVDVTDDGVLVLPSPDPTAWVATTADDGFLIRADSEATDAQRVAVALSVPERKWHKTGAQLTTGKSGNMVYFDASDSGKDARKAPRFHLRPGTYEVDRAFKVQAVVDGDKVVLNTVIRFRRLELRRTRGAR